MITSKKQINQMNKLEWKKEKKRRGNKQIKKKKK